MSSKKESEINNYSKSTTSDRSGKKNDADFNEYLMAMKRERQSIVKNTPPFLTPRERRRNSISRIQGPADRSAGGGWSAMQQIRRISTIASMVPDEIIYNHAGHGIRTYETALMFIDISGFTELCECYTKPGRGGPSRLTQVLNSLIGAMIQEILMHNGDILKFSGDAFLSMWKKSPKHTMQDVVHTAIDCGLIIQKNYGTYVTDVGVILKVKVAISAGELHFSLIGGEHPNSQLNYVIVGQPVWDVKMAQYISTAGDVLTSASVWMYVIESEYCTQPCGDGRHTKVLGIGATWKRVENALLTIGTTSDLSTLNRSAPKLETKSSQGPELYYREFSLRPAVVSALKSADWPSLGRFMVAPVLRAVYNDEPMDFLTEVRRVVVVFLNIITKSVTESVLIGVVHTAYKCVNRLTSALGGMVNKVSMFDKDMMFLVVFGLRGLKQEDEARKALQCAYQLKEHLNDQNIISVSIGVTSGTTYCGVVGHVLRREYTVIGPAVNKAARLMMAYPQKITCDKETFLRSKLAQDRFRMVERKILKGIPKPGPIYEFDKYGWSERTGSNRHPIIGRNKELQTYKETIETAIREHGRKFTRYRDHKYAFVLIGLQTIGKTRLLEECIYVTPPEINVETFILSENNREPFILYRMLLAKAFACSDDRINRMSCENIVRYNFDVTSLSPIQLYAMNSIFHCRFPLPERYDYEADFLGDMSVKLLLQEFFKRVFKDLWVAAVREAQYMDEDSWRMLLIILETKTIFFLMTITEDDDAILTETSIKCLENGMVVNIQLEGIVRRYLAAVACQLLDVQAIPADLEKVIENASRGLPGWIQNFVISLVQRGVLSVVTTTVTEAREAGAVMPSLALLQRTDSDSARLEEPTLIRQSYQRLYSFMSASMLNKQEDSRNNIHDSDEIQMAVLSEGFTFDDLTVDMTMDAVILKTYDSLTHFEKLLLKCGSVLGEVFSRRMLLHLMQSDSPRKVAQAVAKLFLIRVLECEGGDFTRDASLVLVLPAPAMPVAMPPYCACLGIRPPANCRDLPPYAFCGYMRFRHSLFRTTTYDLLTESQKHEMHARALLYLERYTQRCVSCGFGCFVKLLGQRCNDVCTYTSSLDSLMKGLVIESEELKRIRQQLRDLSAETKFSGVEDITWQYSQYTRSSSDLPMDGKTDVPNSVNDVTSYELYENDVRKNLSQIICQKDKHVRSFSSLEISNCECLSILLAVYCQVIDHCRGAGQREKLFEAYLEYADLNIINQNIPQAIRLLFEVETLVKTQSLSKNKCNWMKDFRLANILTLRGICMLETGDLSEAKTLLLDAMKLYYYPFPISKHSVRLRNIFASFSQCMALYIAPHWYVGIESGVVGRFYEDIATTLSALFRLFIETKQIENATLAAKWSLKYALQTNANFRVLCISYGNIISIYRLREKFSLCQMLEERAMELCYRKKGQLDVTEVHAVCYLYTNIFLFYVEHGKKVKSLEFGLSVMHMMSSLTDLSTRQMLILWMLKLLLSDLRIHDMVSIMREFFYMSDNYDLSSETWYYFYAMVILLDTGYCVQSYGSCERFYINKGDAILRAKSPEAAWNFFVSMWLITIRIGAWERSILWDEKIKQVLNMKFETQEFNIMMFVRLVEGLLITLVKEVLAIAILCKHVFYQQMDNRNIKKIYLMEKSLKAMFQEMKSMCTHAPMYLPRYYLLYAYFHYIRGEKFRGYRYLNKTSELCKQYSHGTLLIWTEHTRNHWKGTLNPKLENYWVDHIEGDHLLDYKNFDLQRTKIVPYTLPLPRDLER